MAEEVEVEIVFDPIFGAQSKKKIIRESGNTGRKSGVKFVRGFSRSLSGLSSKALGIGAAFAGAFALRGIVNAVSEIEKLETSLGILLGSTQLAKETLVDLQSFAASTPFQLPGIADAANQLIVAGTAVEDLEDQLTVLGNIAAGTGKDFREITQVFVQVRQEGKLTGERLRQLFERNIPIVSALAKEMGVAEEQVRDLTSKGKVDIDTFTRAFRSLSDEGGLFAGAIERQSRTVGGVLSTLKDNFFNLQVEIGRTFGPAIISTANDFIKIFQSFSAKVAANGPSLVKAFSSLADIFITTPSKFWLDFFAGNGSQNLAQTNTEIIKLEKSLAQVERRLELTKDSALARIFGGRKQALQDFGDIAAKLTELRLLQTQLTASTNSDTQAVKDGLAAKRELAALENKRIADEVKRQQIRDSLGNVGISKDQQILAQSQKDIAALTLARENEAITEIEFNERKFIREEQLQQQLGSLRDQENQKRLSQIEQQEQAALNNEKSLGDSLSRVSGQFKKVAGEFKVTSKDIAKALVSGIGNAAASGFAAFGKALVTGENALKAFGQAVLASLGNALVQMGSGFILQGVAQSIAGFGSGGPLIAAGAAMVTFGGALGAISGGASTVSGSESSSGSGGGVASNENDNEITSQQEESEQQTTVTLNIQGDVLDSQETGIRLVSIINNAFESDGAVITNGAFA